MYDYKFIFIFTMVSLILAVIIPLLSKLLTVNSNDLQKMSIYECGFDPFADSSQKFEISFFLVAILFIIFDLEVSFLFPWALVFNQSFNYWSMVVFFIILTIGLVYEWLKGGLEWE